MRWVLLLALLAGCNRKPVPVPEQTYQGKPRSEWARLALDTNSRTRQEACEALDATGGDANLDPQTKAILEAWHAQKRDNQRAEFRRIAMAADEKIFRQQQAMHEAHISLPFEREDDWDTMEEISQLDPSDPSSASKGVALIRKIAAHDRYWWKRNKMEKTIKSLGKSASPLGTDLQNAWSLTSSEEDKSRLFDLIKSVR